MRKFLCLLALVFGTSLSSAHVVVETWQGPGYYNNVYIENEDAYYGWRHRYDWGVGWGGGWGWGNWGWGHRWGHRWGGRWGGHRHWGAHHYWHHGGHRGHGHRGGHRR